MKTFKPKNLVALATIAAIAPLAHAGVCDNAAWANLASVTRANAPVNANCIDASTDMSAHIKDSYNTSTKIAAPTVKSTTDQATVDTQSASNSASQVGPRQSASQGGFSLGSATAGSTSLGGGYKSPVRTGDVTQSNSTVIQGPNWGNVSQSAQASTAGDAVGGDKGGIIGSVLGNSQALTAGSQSLGQVNSQNKTSSNQSYSSNPVITHQH